MTLTELRKHYSRYITVARAAFDAGYDAYERADTVNPYDSREIDAEAWEKGAECAKTWHRMLFTREAA